MSKRRRLVEWFLLAALVAVNVFFLIRPWTVEVRRMREEQQQNLRYIEVVLGQKIRGQEQELAECRKTAGPKAESRGKTKPVGFQPMYRPGMADSDRGGN